MSLVRSLLDAVKSPPAPPDPPAGKVPAHGWAPFDGPLAKRPRNRAEVVEMFGDPTRGGLYMRKADPTWVKLSIVECRGPDAFLPVLAKAYFPVHRLVEPYMREAFRRAELAAPGYIGRPGTWGYNFRRIRHSVTGPLSYHAYGIAVDVNPDDNRAVTFAPGKTPAPWSPEWNRIWPRGMPLEVVEAFESCGFSWGGRWKGFSDPMHLEWVSKREAKV